MSHKALRVYDNGGATAVLETVETPKLEAGDVLIDAHYSSINFKDALAVTGKGKIMRRFPTTAGIDVAGVVEASEDERFQPGDQVLVNGYGLGENSDGGLAEMVVTRADYLVPLPEAFSMQDAMALGTAGFTAGISAYRMLQNDQDPEMGKILVTGATGGVGSVATLLLSRLGFEVVALTGKAEQAGDYLSSLGAVQVLDRHALEMTDKPLASVEYAGAVDSVGGDTLSWLTRVTAPEGNLASCGLAGGVKINTTVMPFILRGVNLLGINSVTLPMAVRLKVWDMLAEHIKADDLAAITRQVIGLDEVIQHVGELMDGTMLGRYVVDLKKG
ncbi:zinc-binding dehydrogenase [gamma proteobacterium HTCC5015]|nr:zinc-binding dehydrogenase [gamma proteobacterium HTCC5015]